MTRPADVVNSPMMQLVLDSPAQLRWGLDLPTVDVAPASDVVLLGMGGSGMAAAAGSLGSAPGSVVQVHADYGLPPWAVPRGATVVAVSHSGNTDETVSGFGEAIAAGLPVVAVASGGRIAEMAAAAGAPHVAVPGGMQPRAALGYLSSATRRVLGALGAVDDAGAVIDEAADAVEKLLGGGDGAGYALGLDIAEALLDRLPVVIGAAGPAALAGRRWMTQINENTKRTAFCGEIPELNHNALEAWATRGSDPVRVGVVALTDPAGEPRNERRLDLTMRRLGGAVASAGIVFAHGTSSFARFWSLAAVGDVVSVAMALQTDVDPVPVDILENFKLALRKD